MEREDYYYYGESYYSEEGEEWEVALESAYRKAKSLINTMPEECVAGLRAVERDDPVCGKWTFKALRMLARVHRCTKAYEEMLNDYNRVATFRHEDVSKTNLQRAMTKFIDEAQSVPVEYFWRVLQITINVTSKDMKSFGKLWFNAKLKHAALLLEQNSMDTVLEEMKPVLAWCKEGDQTFVSRCPQLFLSYALLLEVYLKLGDFNRMREVFFMATSMVNTIPSFQVMGSVLECGGRMYMHYSDWPSAFRAFSVAFWNYNESGDLRRTRCFKYLLLTRMLGGSTIDPFATHEAKACEGAAEVAPVVMLMKAFLENDLRRFLDVVDLHRDVFEADAVVHSCLDFALEQLRLQALVAYAAPYQRLCVERLKEVLLVDSDEAERLCVRAVVDGLLNGALDDGGRVLVMQGKQSMGLEAEQLRALSRWSGALLELVEDTKREVDRVLEH